MRRIGVLVVIPVLLMATSALGAHGDGLERTASQAARGRAAAGSPVAPEKLAALLPTLNGWEKGEPSSEVMNMGSLVMSVARVRYDKGDLSLDLEITDTQGNQMLMSPFATMMAAAGPGGKTVDNVTARTFTIAGFTAVEILDSEEKVADVLVAINGRFVVKASLSDANDASAPRAAVAAVNLKALAALK